MASSSLFAQYTPNLPPPPEVKLSGDYSNDFLMIERSLKLALHESNLARRQIDKYRYQSNVGLGITLIGAALTTALALANPDEPVYAVGGVVLFAGAVISLSARKHLKAYPPPRF